MKMNPCKDCEKKGCGLYHDQCSQYQEYKEELEKIRKIKYNNCEYHDYKINASSNSKRNHKLDETSPFRRKARRG